MFEETLIESTRPSRKSGSGISLPVSIALHVLVLAAALGASFWSAEDDPEPPIPVIFQVPGSLPTQPGGSSKPNSVPLPKQRHAAAASQSVAIVTTAPTALSGKEEVPTTPGTESPSTEGDHQETPGTIDDDGDGRGDGGRGGRQIGPGTGTQTILQIGGDVRPPVLITRVEPVYPEIARKLRKEGTIILEAIITTDGTVDDVRIVKSADAFLDEAAKQAVMQWRYRPATLNARAVNVYLTVTVSFRLH